MVTRVLDFAGSESNPSFFFVKLCKAHLHQALKFAAQLGRLGVLSGCNGLVRRQSIGDYYAKVFSLVIVVLWHIINTERLQSGRPNNLFEPNINFMANH